MSIKWWWWPARRKICAMGDKIDRHSCFCALIYCALSVDFFVWKRVHLFHFSVGDTFVGSWTANANDFLSSWKYCVRASFYLVLASSTITWFELGEPFIDFYVIHYGKIITESQRDDGKHTVCYWMRLFFAELLLVYRNLNVTYKYFESIHNSEIKIGYTSCHDDGTAAPEVQQHTCTV